MIAKDDKLDGAIPIQDPPQGWPGDFDNEDGTVSTFRKYTVSNPADDERKLNTLTRFLSSVLEGSVMQKRLWKILNRFLRL